MILTIESLENLIQGNLVDENINICKTADNVKFTHFLGDPSNENAYIRFELEDDGPTIYNPIGNKGISYGWALFKKIGIVPPMTPLEKEPRKTYQSPKVF